MSAKGEGYMRVSFLRTIVIAAAGATVVLLVLLPSRFGTGDLQGIHAISVPQKPALPAVHLAASTDRQAAWVHPAHRPSAAPAARRPPAARAKPAVEPPAPTAQLASAPAPAASRAVAATPSRAAAQARATVRRQRFRALRRILGRTRPARPAAPTHASPPPPAPTAPEVAALADTLAPATTVATPTATPTATPPPAADDAPARGVHIHWLHRK
jgi:hypothetical protein